MTQAAPVIELGCAMWEAMPDDEVVSRVLGGDTALYEVLMRRYNQRLYRVARSILHDGAEAEDVMQEAYVRAFEHLREFAGEAKFSTWLTKIAVYEALRRVRRRGRTEDLDGGIMDHRREIQEIPSGKPTITSCGWCWSAPWMGYRRATAQCLFCAPWRGLTSPTQRPAWMLAKKQSRPGCIAPGRSSEKTCNAALALSLPTCFHSICRAATA